MKILYISYDGLTDPLGQSQVIPYLNGLSNEGHNISILSFEKKKAFITNQYKISVILNENGIDWIPLTYHFSPPILGTLFDVVNMWRTAKKLHKKHDYEIVHCRSYISALIGLKLKKKFDTKFIFDMRGLWADERVDGHIWDLKNPIFKVIYNYFKRKEIDFLNNANYTISLTDNAKKEIGSWRKINKPTKIKVIPCCVDTQLFQSQLKEHSGIRVNLGITDTDFVLTYLGSIGTWYMLDEMLAFFKILKQDYENAKFLFISKDGADLIRSKAVETGLVETDIIVKAVERVDVPMYLQLSNLSIFFIKPSYSKKASSPTKMGELLSMNIPIICNAGVGDVDSVIKSSNTGVIVEEFSDKAYKIAIEKYKLSDFKNLRETAINYFSLESGVNAYNGIYETL